MRSKYCLCFGKHFKLFRKRDTEVETVHKYQSQFCHIKIGCYLIPVSTIHQVIDVLYEGQGVVSRNKQHEKNLPFWSILHSDLVHNCTEKINIIYHGLTFISQLLYPPTLPGIFLLAIIQINLYNYNIFVTVHFKYARNWAASIFV